MRIVDGKAGAIVEVKVASLPGVREWAEGFPVEVWLNRSGRLVLRAYNEDRHNATEIDVFDLLAWFERENEHFRAEAISALSVA